MSLGDIHRLPGSNHENGIGRTGPWPGLRHCGQKALSTLRKLEPGVKVKIRWYPARKGNEIVDGCAKQAPDESDERGVEWLSYSDRYWKRSMPLPRSLANLKREVAEAKKWSHDRINWKKYRPRKKQTLDPTVARS